MTKQQAIQAACEVLRRRVRFDGAGFTLPGQPFGSDDTKAIRETTRLYVETWIVPLLDAIETGDTKLMKDWCASERGHKINSEPSPS